VQYETRGIHTSAGGDLKMTLAQDGSTVTFAGVFGGIIHAIAASRIWASGTTALKILALF
jgi:hypothetical protein